MGVRVDLETLQEACEWVSAGVDAEASVSRHDGRIVFTGDGIDEDVPHDLDDESIWIAVPRKRELDLGHALVFRFVQEQMPHSMEQVERIFRKSGAFRCFKDLLDAAGRLDQWHAYEQAATEQALQAWCVEVGFEPSAPAAD